MRGRVGPSTPSGRPIVCWRSRVGRCRQVPSSSAKTRSISAPPAWSASAALWHPEHSDAWRSDSRRIEFRIGRGDGRTGNATHPRQGAHVPLLGLAQSRSPGLVICNQRISYCCRTLRLFAALYSRCCRIQSVVPPIKNSLAQMLSDGERGSAEMAIRGDSPSLFLESDVYCHRLDHLPHGGEPPVLH
jgi:hypothetical protein